MKQTIRTSRSAGQLEKMFRMLNQDFFGGMIEEPIITIQSTPGAHGHVTVGKAWNIKTREDSERHELNISAETMARPIEEVTATLVHEMVHLENLRTGVQDCSRGGTYHNKKFKDAAEKTGLLSIGKHEKYGWAITLPTEKLIEYIISQGWEDFNMNRGTPLFFGGLGGVGGAKTGDKHGTGKDTAKTKTSYRRYVCPSCGLIVRATKECELICGDCMTELEWQEKD